MWSEINDTLGNAPDIAESMKIEPGYFPPKHTKETLPRRMLADP